MSAQSKITDVIFDFDGTCTQIPVIYEKYLDKFYEGLVAYLGTMYQTITPEKWQGALMTVFGRSPQKGWDLLSNGKLSAPAAADPFILAGEAAKAIFTPMSGAIHTPAYDANPAPWRADALHTFTELIRAGVKIHFISNSTTDTLQKRLTYLMFSHFGDFKENNSLSVHGGASKYNITLDTKYHPTTVTDHFTSLPEMYEHNELKILNRPVLLKRGNFFDSICEALHGNMDLLPTTLFVGDVWELDLAMPYMLGANIHLIERAAPFDTYQYEKDIVDSCGSRGSRSIELCKVLDWLS